MESIRWGWEILRNMEVRKYKRPLSIEGCENRGEIREGLNQRK